MKRIERIAVVVVAFFVVLGLAASPRASAQEKKPVRFNEFFGREGWRFVFVQDVVLQLGETAINYPPMQDPASFDLTAVKAKIQAAIKSHASQ
jgi:hypothetical protein